MKYFSEVLGLFSGFIVILNLLSVSAFKIYQERIPNGDKIPDVCRGKQTWNGVGHKKSIGGGTLNPFGTHFKRFRKVWGKSLCEIDSDGDGRTNGEELGDPDCTWSVGNTPNKTSDISHPGICEPLTSELCKSKNIWLDCTDEEFKCDAFKEPGVKKITLRLHPSSVPPRETLYMCMMFPLPTDGDYHIIGETPVIDNDYVLHHIILFGCSQISVRDKIRRTKPYRCGMAPSHYCNEMLSLWSFGSKGHCGSPHAGFRIGVNGYKYAAIQLHWNNPEKRRSYTDSSGLVLYYTPNLRPYDAGVLTVGQMSLTIPPYQEHFEVTALCDEHCSDTIMESNIYVVESLNHMHYKGIAEKVELFRNKKFKKIITLETNYNYDNPVTHQYATPIEILKGDELKTTCTFQSNNTNTTTYFGEDTAAEMCFAFLHYYPKQNLINNYCLSYRSLPMCEMYGNNSLRKNAVIHGCNFSEVYKFTEGDMGYFLFGVLAKCKKDRCVPECIPITKRKLEHPCFQGDLAPYMKEGFYNINYKLSDSYYSKVNPCIEFLTSCPNCTAANLSSWYDDDDYDTTVDSNTTEAIYTSSDSLTNNPETSNYTQRSYTDEINRTAISGITTKSTTSGKSTTTSVLSILSTRSKASRKSQVTMVLVVFECFTIFIITRSYIFS